MAYWYCSSVAYAAVAQWATATVYPTGSIVRQKTTPAMGSERCFRNNGASFTSSATAEPTWVLTVGATTADGGGGTWTEVTANATYNWSAPAATLSLACARMVTGGPTDIVYVSSDHSETWASTFISLASTSYVVCVNRAGSVPPVNADVTTGAFVGTANGISMQLGGRADTQYFQGITFSIGSGGATACQIQFGIALSPGNVYLKNCALVVNSTSASSLIEAGGTASRLTLDNTTLQFGQASQYIYVTNCGELRWINTPSAIQGATLPSVLFGNGGQNGRIDVRNVDLSALSGKTLFNAGGYWNATLTNCKLPASVTIATMTGFNTAYNLDLVNCDNSVNYQNAIWRGPNNNSMTTSATVYRTGGATDGTTPVSHKYVTTSSATQLSLSYTMEGMPLVIWNTLTGASHTITIELLTDNVILKNSDIWFEVEYLGDASSPLGSRATSLDIVAPNTGTASANLNTSAATWTTTGIVTPKPQNVTISFTPQKVGLIRVQPRITKPSTTIYIDPFITLV
jgi:hypothetical protein